MPFVRPPRCDLLKPAVPPCEVGTLTVTILLLAGSGSFVVTTFPPTEVPVIWKVCPPDVATVVSVPAPNNANKTIITTNTITTVLKEVEKQHFQNALHFGRETCQHCLV